MNGETGENNKITKINLNLTRKALETVEIYEAALFSVKGKLKARTFLFSQGGGVVNGLTAKAGFVAFYHLLQSYC